MDPFNDMAQPFTDHSHHAFIKAAGATVAGVAVGSMLDHTRFGRWFNTSPVIGAIFSLIKLGIIGLVMFYVYCVIKVW